MQAFAVVDLGFGDAGKGLITDWLVRHVGATAVVRFNGGPQAGHTVVAPDGRRHTFSSFGAGSFMPQVETYLSHHVALHPTAMAVEAQALADKGVPQVLSRTFIHRDCPVITPFHQAANRLRELARGRNRHGSCGVGHGELVDDTLHRPDSVIRAHELWSRPSSLRKKLEDLQEHKRAELRAAAPDVESNEWDILESDSVIDAWLERLHGVTASVRLFETLQSRTTVFEGAQGVLLDERAGFAPHTTWSNCTFDNAASLWAEASPGVPLMKIGVMRTHMVRHGAGPLPTETTAFAHAVTHESNVDNPWQGPVRYGWFDAQLVRQSIKLCQGLDALAVTHVDLGTRASLRFADEGGQLNDLGPAPASRIAEVLDVPLALQASGPSSRDVTSQDNRLNSRA